MVTITHGRGGHFTVAALDENQDRTGEILVNVNGQFSGTVPVGIFPSRGEAAYLEVTAADALWRVTIEPFTEAPELPEDGRGSGVFRRDGSAETWEVSYSGRDSTFALYQFAGIGDGEMLINQPGRFEETVEIAGGDSIIVISSPGNNRWSITQQ